MKKIRRTMIIGLLFVFLLGTGCGNKEAITANEFVQKMEENEFLVVDITDQYDDKLLSAVQIAYSDEYQIEFYIFNEIDQAIRDFNQNKDHFAESKVQGAIESTVSVGNHSKYTLRSAGRYMVISRIENTFIYLNTPVDYTTEIEEILKNLGY